MTLARTIVCLAIASLAVAGAAGADGAALQGSVGPGFTISVQANGANVTHLDAGSYSLAVDDKSDEHNFHLSGPGGVDARTEVEGTGGRDVQSHLVDGKYTFICDAHPTRMTGSFTVGAVQSTPPPKPTAPQKLTLTLTAKAVTLTKPGGARVTSLATGPAVITVHDRSATRGVKLRGIGVVKSTGIGFVGSLTWSVKLGAGPLALTTQGKTPALKGPRVTVS